MAAAGIPQRAAESMRGAGLKPSVYTGELADPRERLPQALVSLMRDIGIPNGIGTVGFVAADLPDLVEGTLKQQRILTMAPRDVMASDLPCR